MRLFIVEDEKEICDTVAKSLYDAGYEVDTCYDGEEALAGILTENYDLVVLDLNLPGMDGMEILKELRQENEETKVLILSARGQIADKVEALDAGANDYMEKPFHLQELEARIRSLTRRKFVQKDVCLESGEIKFDTVRREAYAKGEMVSLTRKENGILEYLLLNMGRPVSQEELMEHVWDASVDSFSGAIRVHMSSLRKKLKAVLGYDPILNKVGEGYKIREESDRCKKMSLQWRLTCIITLYIAVICGCVTMLVYKNGVYYMDSLQEAVDTRGDDQPDDAEEIYISIPEDKWDEFANDFLFRCIIIKADYRKNSLIISAVLALLGGVATYFISGHALRPIRELSDKIEKVQAQNLADSRIEENQVKELNQLSVSYNRMLERLSAAFEIQRQFTANAAHELRTPLALMQVQLDLYHSNSHPDNDADTVQMIKMVTEQNDRLNKMVKTLLDMSELQTVGRDDEIILDALVDEVLEDLEPLAEGKNIRLIGKCKDITMVGSDILIYRLVYNLVENAIKYNHSGGQVTVTADRKEKHVYLSVEDTGTGIPEELKERVFEPFFRVDKSRSRELGGVGLGLALVREIVRVHDGSITVKANPSGGTIFEVVL